MPLTPTSHLESPSASGNAFRVYQGAGAVFYQPFLLTLPDESLVDSGNPLPVTITSGTVTVSGTVALANNSVQVTNELNVHVLDLPDITINNAANNPVVATLVGEPIVKVTNDLRALVINPTDNPIPVAIVSGGGGGGGLTDAELRATAVLVSGTFYPATQDANITQVGGSGLSLGQKTRANSIPVTLPSDGAGAPFGTWGYSAGTSGTLTLTGGKRVLLITAIAVEASASFTINGGDSIQLPYGGTDKVGSALTIKPSGNLTNPTIVFTNTKSYFVEYVT